MTDTNITAECRRSFQALSSGDYENFALFSCFDDNEAAVAIVAVNQCPPSKDGGEPEFHIQRLFVSVTSAMTVADHEGTEA